MDEDLAIALGRAALAHLRRQHPVLYRKVQRISPATFRYLKAQSFLRAYCRVVYGSGFRADLTRSKMPALEHAFHRFDLAALADMDTLEPVLAVFHNQRKARCFLAGAQAIAREGWPHFKRRIRQGGLEVLQELPGIGPITRYELAKGIGFLDVPKPDRWLRRAAALCGAQDPFELVAYLAAATGESQQVIDVALWRYAVDGQLPATGENHAAEGPASEPRHT
jgi:hypothetical protein